VYEGGSLLKGGFGTPLSLERVRLKEVYREKEDENLKPPNLD